jgi:hypothetical protein
MGKNVKETDRSLLLYPVRRKKASTNRAVGRQTDFNDSADYAGKGPG